ncbi:MAG: beta-ketoacyl-[acyl-carrier-protein] synthase II, partial [Dehalococcoidia bacterium]
MTRRVVVTGLGLVTPLGNDVTSNWEALVAGRSGIGTISLFDTSAYDFPIAGEVRNFEPSDFVDSKLLRRIDRSTVFALAAAQNALADAGLNMAAENVRRVGVVVGTGIGSAQLIVEQAAVLAEKGPRRVSP